MKKEVAILTINDDMNYGNRLQNYAVQQFLIKNEVDCCTIENKTGYYGIKWYIHELKDLIVRIIKKDNMTKRYINFKKFNKNIVYSRYKIDKKHIPKDLHKKYDTFITGSDQVWNPFFDRGSNVDFLSFAPEEKRVSFSASFGINEIPEEYRENFARELKKFKNISVREDRAKEIVEELTGRDDVEVLVDPTMLLTSEEWDKIAKKPKQLKSDKYILNYFLGELSEERKLKIEKIAKENNCEIINLLDKNSPFYQTNPSEFLYLEENAFLICTDSFHSCIFAILFNKPFIVFDREDGTKIKMNSRLETLLKKFGLEERWYNGEIDNKLLEVDYSKAYKILEKEKEKSKEFLIKAIDIKESD